MARQQTTTPPLLVYLKVELVEHVAGVDETVCSRIVVSGLEGELRDDTTTPRLREEHIAAERGLAPQPGEVTHTVTVLDKDYARGWNAALEVAGETIGEPSRGVLRNMRRQDVGQTIEKQPTIDEQAVELVEHAAAFARDGVNETVCSRIVVSGLEDELLSRVKAIIGAHGFGWPADVRIARQ
jgi:hypothetical protein